MILNSLASTLNMGEVHAVSFIHSHKPLPPLSYCLYISQTHTHTLMAITCFLYPFAYYDHCLDSLTSPPCTHTQTHTPNYIISMLFFLKKGYSWMYFFISWFQLKILTMLKWLIGWSKRYNSLSPYFSPPSPGTRWLLFSCSCFAMWVTIFTHESCRSRDHKYVIQTQRQTCSA